MESSEVMSTILFPALLAFIMMGMGMSLVPRDFKRVAQLPRAVFLGLLAQLVVLPLLALAIALALDLSPVTAAALMLVAACPGGAVSNLISFLARANVALSVTLTAFSALVTVFTIPLIANLSLAHFVGSASELELSFWQAVWRLALLTLLPIAIGMVLRHRFARFAIASQPWLNRAAVVFLVALIAGIAAAERDRLVDALIEAGPPAALLNVLSVAIGYGLARTARLGERNAITIAIESGFQNASVAIVIAITMLGRPDLAIVPAVYALVMYVPAFALVWRSRRLQAARVF